MNTKYTVWCEWDIGYEDKVFSSKNEAMAWLKNNSLLEDLCYQFDTSINGMIRMGYLQVDKEENV